MDFLIRAEKYARARNDVKFFRHVYEGYRSHQGVREAVKNTLTQLYGPLVADLLDYQ